MSEFALTKLESTYEITKKFVQELDEDGSHKRKATPFSKGKAIRQEFKDMYHFGKFLDGLGTHDALMVGYNEKETTFIAPKSQLDKYEGTIARSKENYPFNTGVGLLFIDYDANPKKDQPVYSKEVLLELIFDTIPELRKAPLLWKPSSGSCIWNLEDHDWEVGVEGQHIFFLISDQQKCRSILYHLKDRIAGIDVQVPQGNRLIYQSCTCEHPFEKRDEKHDIRNNKNAPFDAAEYSDGTIKSEKQAKFSALGARSWDDTYDDIRLGISFHDGVRNLAWGMARDDMNAAMIKSTIRMAMKGVPDENRRSEWQDRYDDIDRQVDSAIDYYTTDVKGVIAKGDSEAFVPTIDNYDEGRADPPEFPFGVMENWPEPWPQIWDTWKKFPRVLSEPLLIPTILSFHAFFLNGKYRNFNNRRPNMYFLNIAESTAFKDTNSSDVIRDFGIAMMNNERLNTIFDSLTLGASSITADSTFIETINKNDGKFYWFNTEATRIFQQLNSTGNHNSQALADKMIEVVDGHEIKGKARAAKNEHLKTIKDPNVQILFYAQPETIEKHMTTDMIDSGLLGRAIITVESDIPEVDSFFQEPDKKEWKQISTDLLNFYTSGSPSDVTPVVKVSLWNGPNKQLVQKFEKDVMRPMIAGLDEGDNSADKNLHKMISRIANSTEQLFSVVVGICQQWDIMNGFEVRSPAEISIAGMLPMIEYWTKSKYYIVTEFIGDYEDALVNAVEETMVAIITGHLKTPGAYINHKDNISAGYIPRGLLISSLRKRSKGISKHLGIPVGDFTSKINRTIDIMLSADIIMKKDLRANRSLVGKRAPCLYFPTRK